MLIERRTGLLALLVAVVLFSGTAILLAQDATPADNAPATTKADENAAENNAPAENAPAANAAENNAEATTETTTEPSEEPVEVKGGLQEQWFDFLYYINVARPAAAKSYGQALVQANKPVELYTLTTLHKSADWDSTLTRGEKLEGLADTIAAVRKQIEAGYQQQRSNVDFINESINMLGDTARAYELAARRLESSGEYAMPQLVQRMVSYLASDKKDPRETIVFERIINVLPRIGKQAVRPLSEVLKSDDPQLQKIAVNALAQIEYPHSAPALKELAQRKGVQDSIKEAALRALQVVAGPQAKDKSVADLYYQLAESYYNNYESLQPDSRFDTANVWYWTGKNLTYKVVPAKIFTDIYAMRMAAEALKNDGTYYPAVGLWLSADLRKEADLPKGAKDPTMGTAQMPAEFYALASSAKYLQDVLDRALNDNNAAVAIGAIKALSQTVSAGSLVGNAGKVGPLIKALSNSDRQVRFQAAVALANALPKEKFSGQELVPAVLNEALRQTGHKTALIVVADEKVRNQLKDAVRTAGFEIIEQSDIVKAMDAVRGSAGIDVAVVSRDPGAARVIAALRQDPLMAGTPVVALDSTQEFNAIARKDKKAIALLDTKADAVAAALTKALAAGAGTAMTPEIASAWAVQAADALRLLGLTNNTVIDYNRSEAGLMGALEDKRPEVQVAAAKALAMMASPKAQQSIATLAMKSTDEKVRIQAFAALTESVKKFGNQTTEEQSTAIVDLVNDAAASKDLRQAAAATLGAMNLPSEKIKSMILQLHSNG